MFDINNHIAAISEKKIQEIMESAFSFFKGTPYFPLSNLPDFEGAGVYALFLESTSNTVYKDCLPPMYPIYIGKAVHSGSRQGKKTKIGKALRNRLKKHLRSIEQVENLNEKEFLCRFILLQGSATDLIGAVESHFIRKYNPLWNSSIDGFGINAPGAGRANQSPSEWDTLHPGRYYAKNLTGEPRDKRQILEKLVRYSTSDEG